MENIEEYISSLMNAGVIQKEKDWRAQIKKEELDYGCNLSNETVDHIISVLQYNGLVWMGLEYDE